MNYLIRDMPKELHRAAKIRAAELGISVKELIMRAVKQYLEATK